MSLAVDNSVRCQTSNCILFVVNSPAFFLSHRLTLALAAKEEGYDVHIASAKGHSVEEIIHYGLVHHALPIRRSSLNPFREILTFFALVKLFFRLKPSLVHLVTIKPVIYGGIAARLTGVQGAVAAVSGLGFAFTARGLKARLARSMASVFYRLAMGKHNMRIIFQNPDDRDVLVNMGVVDTEKVVMIPGSGVDLSHYSYKPEPEGVPVVTFASRLLRDKGVFEFVESARLLRQCGVKALFLLAGDIDPDNPTAISQKELEFWRQEGCVEILGYRQDIAALFAASNLVVLPSYYGEGLPKVLIEAAACGRTVITTDHPGCRHAIEPGVTGLTVPVRHAEALADAIRELLEDPDKRKRMGQAGRRLAEREFSIDRVVAEHLRIYKELLEGGR